MGYFFQTSSAWHSHLLGRKSSKLASPAPPAAKSHLVISPKVGAGCWGCPGAASEGQEVAPMELI